MSATVTDLIWQSFLGETAQWLELHVRFGGRLPELRSQLSHSRGNICISFCYLTSVLVIITALPRETLHMK